MGGLAMKLPRRQFLRLTAGTATLPALPRIASALDYPTRPVRIIDGFPPGGASDIVARLTAQWLSQRLHQQFIVENRPGASSNIAAEAVVQAPADGYTLLFFAPAGKRSDIVFRDLIQSVPEPRSLGVYRRHAAAHGSGLADLKIAIAHAVSGPNLNAASARGSGSHECASAFRFF
jgi:hypothetical protein